MRKLQSTIIIFLLCFLCINQSKAQKIPPKTALGVYLDAAPPESGVIYSVKATVPNSTADAMGIKAGDILLSVNDKALIEQPVLYNVLGSSKYDDPISFEVLRGEKKLKLTGKMKARVRVPHNANAEILLEEVPFRDGLMRAIVNKPKGKGPFKTIFYLQGYPCQSVDYQNPNLTLLKLMHRWVDQGYAVFRVEKPGAGQSYNCRPCDEMTFEDELEGFTNGYEKLLSLDFVDKENVILYGHSLGGIVAPYLASKFNPKGVMTYGTLVNPWEEYVIDMMRYQQTVLGVDYAQNEKELRSVKDILYQVFSLKKDIRSLSISNQQKHILDDKLDINTEKATMAGRPLKFWVNLNEYNPTAFWKGVNAKVLSMYGSSDIQAIDASGAERIAEIVNFYHPGNARFELIQNADHGLATVPSQLDYMKLQGNGQYGQIMAKGINKQFLEVVDDFLMNLDGVKTSKTAEKINDTYQNSSYNLPAYLTEYGTMDVESGDLDKDGDEDLVLAMEGHANVVLFNDGKGAFPKHVVIKPKHAPIKAHLSGEDSEDIALADFDKDGDLDILFITEDTPYHELMFNDGKGNFTHAEYNFKKSYPANALAVLDLNKDGYPDVIIGNNGPNEVFINQKDGTFKDMTAQYWPDNDDGTQDLKVVDIDKDGDLDIIEGAERGGSNIFHFKGGQFQEVTSTYFPSIEAYETRKVVIEDINEDGWKDIFLCNVGWNPQMNPKNIILINQSGKKFEDATEQYLPNDANTTLDAHFVDVNQDNKKDLIITNGYSDYNLKVYIQQQNGYAFAKNVLPKVEANTSIALKVADFNGDDVLDFYIGNHNEADAFILSKQ
ncbi:MAG: FG-GAP-like repeat-containing protein [Bacteroidota bacterium]